MIDIKTLTQDPSRKSKPNTARVDRSAVRGCAVTGSGRAVQLALREGAGGEQRAGRVVHARRAVRHDPARHRLHRARTHRRLPALARARRRRAPDVWASVLGGDENNQKNASARTSRGPPGTGIIRVYILLS